MGIERAAVWATRRKHSGGRSRTGHDTRSERLVMCVYEDEARDLNALCEAWGVARSTLMWAIQHDFLQRGRVVSAELGEVRGQLKSALTLALRDAELGPWLRAEIAKEPHG